MTTTYRVDVFLDGELVMIRVPEIDLLSQARSVAHAEASARELIAVWLDVARDQVAVEMDYTQISPHAVSLARSAQEQARAAERSAAQAALDWRQAARTLVARGLSRRDTAAVLGVTVARVQQLVGKASTAERAP